MATIKIVLRKDKVNKKTGLAPIYIRIIKDRKSKFLSLGVKIEPKYWNEEKSAIRKGAVNYKELNSFILKKRAEAERTSLELESKSVLTTTQNIKEQIIGVKPKLFFDYANNKMDILKHSLSPSTYRNYKYNLKKIERFAGSGITFNEIDLNFVKNFQEYMYKIDNSDSTINGTFKTLKLFFNYAIKEGFIDYGLYPFKNYKFKGKKGIRHYLNEEQFKHFCDFEDKLNETEKIYYDMFIFSCYAGGLRFFDVLELKLENFIEAEQRLVKVIRKTGRKHQFKFPEKAISIIEKYIIEDTKSTDYIFPLLRNDIDYNTNNELIYSQRALINQRANNIIREIGVKLELPFKLTFHSARHTFATRALNKGMRIEHVSKILDHSSISITQIYAKIINKELDKAMDIMND